MPGGQKTLTVNNGHLWPAWPASQARGGGNYTTLIFMVWVHGESFQVNMSVITSPTRGYRCAVTPSASVHPVSWRFVAVILLAKPHFVGTCLTRVERWACGLYHCSLRGGGGVGVRDVSCGTTKGGRCAHKTFQKVLDSIAVSVVNGAKAAQVNFSSNNESVINLSTPRRCNVLLVSQWTWMSKLMQWTKYTMN